MNREDFGKLIAALRKEHEDEDLRPWTQTMLAEEANLASGIELFTEDTISSIERGKRSMDQLGLQAMATALQLTSGERKEFFLAATGIDSQEIPRQENSPEEVFFELLTYLKQLHLPATLLDQYCDSLAVNHTLIELYDLASCGWTLGSQENKRFPHNEMRFIFSDEVANHLGERMGEHWPTYAANSMMLFRTRSLRYRATEYFKELMIELKKSRLFKRYWREVYYQEKDHNFNAVDIRMNSPRWGAISCFTTTRIAITTAGELYLGVVVPADFDTASAFARITQETGAPVAYCMEAWPNKDPEPQHLDIRIIT